MFAFENIFFIFVVDRIVKHAAHLPLVHAHELMAGINIALRSDGNILVAAAAPAKSLDSTRSLIKIDHEMEEVEARTVLLSLYKYL